MMRGSASNSRPPRPPSWRGIESPRTAARPTARQRPFWSWRQLPHVRSKGLRVLITGGSGFVGSHLAEAFLGRGDEVYVLDDLSTGAIDNITHLKDRPRF